ncbi:MAG: hypothetical protein MN733_10500 [Nitrososphaera sp.]|nr:hypothetical protein [Nitrososphaera sp.]
MNRWYPVAAAVALCSLVELFKSPSFAAKTDGQPRVQQSHVILGDGQLVIFCDSDRGNLLYVFITPKGSSIAVVPGGCKNGE